MFDVHKFLFRLDRPFFWPAAGLNPDLFERLKNYWPLNPAEDITFPLLIYRSIAFFCKFARKYIKPTANNCFFLSGVPFKIVSLVLLGVLLA